MPSDTETSKPSSAKPRSTNRRAPPVTVDGRAAAPAGKAATTRAAAAKAATPRGDTRARPRRAPAAAPSPAPQVHGAPSFDHEIRRALIAQAAYFRAERRGFAAGGEELDWLAAEAEVDALLADGKLRAANDE